MNKLFHYSRYEQYYNACFPSSFSNLLENRSAPLWYDVCVRKFSQMCMTAAVEC